MEAHAGRRPTQATGYKHFLCHEPPCCAAGSRAGGADGVLIAGTETSSARAETAPLPA